jgi:hypothetical protein
LKPIRTFEQHINERMSDEVYHYTTSKAAYSILKGNKLYGTIATDDGTQRPTIGPSAPYFISFTRTKYASVGYSKMVRYNNDHGLGWVRLVIDGRGINNHGKSAPFDFGYGDEMEDRLWMDKPFIPYVRKYIKSIHIYGRNDNDSTEKYNKAIEEMANKYGIPVFFYFGNKTAFDLMDITKTKMTYWDDIEPEEDIDNNNIDTTDAKNIAILMAAISHDDPLGEKMYRQFMKSIDWPLSDNKRYVPNGWEEYINKWVDDYLIDFSDKVKMKRSWLHHYKERVLRDYRTAFNTIQHKALAVTIEYMKKRGYKEMKDLFLDKKIAVYSR